MAHDYSQLCAHLLAIMLMVMLMLLLLDRVVIRPYRHVPPPPLFSFACLVPVPDGDGGIGRGGVLRHEEKAGEDRVLVRQARQVTTSGVPCFFVLFFFSGRFLHVDLHSGTLDRLGGARPRGCSHCHVLHIRAVMFDLPRHFVAEEDATMVVCQVASFFV